MGMEYFKNKKVLVMGLGLLGGGVASTTWLVKHGAQVTVTDLRSRRDLAPALKALGNGARKVRFTLGRHEERDFKASDLVVVNPAVPRESKFLKIARRAGAEITNDARLFFDIARNPVVAVTGTRGKTTTTNWVAHLLRARDPAALAAGNTPERPLLQDLDRLMRRPDTPAVLELSSWQLELLAGAHRAPDVAVITNLFPDHLNRYRGMEQYARAKSAIFEGQNPAQTLVLSTKSAWTPFFLRLRPKGRVYFFGIAGIPARTQGLSIHRGELVFTEAGITETVAGKKFVRDFLAAWGAHNLENLLAAMLAAHLLELPWHTMISRVPTLPHIPYRQEIVIKRKHLLVVNDSAGTSPDATIAALARFKGPHTYLITGGTDKKLEFRDLARAIQRTVPAARAYFLNGSATKKLLAELVRQKYFKGTAPRVFEALPDLLRAVAEEKPGTVLFSPGAASFEKFRNEFDRGQRFTAYSRKVFSRT